jgi:hypothetical protein
MPADEIETQNCILKMYALNIAPDVYKRRKTMLSQIFVIARTCDIITFVIFDVFTDRTLSVTKKLYQKHLG